MVSRETMDSVFVARSSERQQSILAASGDMMRKLLHRKSETGVNKSAQIDRQSVGLVNSALTHCSKPVDLYCSKDLYLGRNTANSTNYIYRQIEASTRSNESKPLTMVAAKQRVQSRLPCESTRSLLQAYSTLRCESKVSVPTHSKFHCECI